jgi:hypothetical protein
MSKKVKIEKDGEFKFTVSDAASRRKLFNGSEQECITYCRRVGHEIIPELPKLTFQWKAQGDANQYFITYTDNTKKPGDLSQTDWVGSVQLNGELSTTAQVFLMEVMTKALAEAYKT